jgi:hypothetical protein
MQLTPGRRGNIRMPRAVSTSVRNKDETENKHSIKRKGDGKE